jgi:hypothetical protein
MCTHTAHVAHFADLGWPIGGGQIDALLLTLSQSIELAAVRYRGSGAWPGGHGSGGSGGGGSNSGSPAALQATRKLSVDGSAPAESATGGDDAGGLGERLMQEPAEEQSAYARHKRAAEVGTISCPFDWKHAVLTLC